MVKWLSHYLQLAQQKCPMLLFLTIKAGYTANVK